MERADRFKELRDLTHRQDLAPETEVLSNLGFMASLLRQSDRSNIQVLTRAALQGLLVGYEQRRGTLKEPEYRKELARLAVDVAEATLAELSMRGHAAGR